jgi:hypothetical protein
VTSDPEQGSIKDSGVVVAAVGDLGLLFLSDPKRTNAIQILTGAFPRGSWWSHPAANQIYQTLHAVEQHPDLLSAKLLSGKVTFVHRRLWPALLAVVTAREPWQMANLSPGAVQWLATLDESPTQSEVAQPSRTVIKEIEARLLARSESVHTPQGRHETRLEPWVLWATRAGCPVPPGLSSAEGKVALQSAAARLGSPAPPLPWSDP